MHLPLPNHVYQRYVLSSAVKICVARACGVGRPSSWTLSKYCLPEWLTWCRLDRHRAPETAGLSWSIPNFPSQSITVQNSIHSTYKFLPMLFVPLGISKDPTNSDIIPLTLFPYHIHNAAYLQTRDSRQLEVRSLLI